MRVFALVCALTIWNAPHSHAVVWDYLQQTGPPDIFFLGMPKAGTTSLHEYLITEAGVCGGVEKEYHYFEFHHTGVASYNEYRKNFQWCPPNRLTLDGSPSNSGFQARENIFRTYTKEELHKKLFIFILREPIDRMYSWFNFQRAKSSEECAETNANCAIYKAEYTHLESFKEYYEFNKFYGLKEGAYVERVSKLLYNFSRSPDNHVDYPILPRRNVFIVNLDTLKFNSSDTLHRLVRFLGVTATNFTMPYVNDLSTQMEDTHLKPIRMKCHDYLHYKPLFDEKNEGLLELINNHPDKPVEEPYFPQFMDKYAERCSHAYEHEDGVTEGGRGG